MGADRDIRPADRNCHKFRRNDELHRHLTSRQKVLIELDINGHPGDDKPRLRDIVPKVGMMWPFKTFLVGNSDAKINAALRKVTPHLSETKVDNLFSQMFVEATKILKNPTPFSGGHPFLFINALQKNKYVRRWAKNLHKYTFVILFLVLRTARKNWFLDPELPVDIHCQPRKLALAIDEFTKVDTLNWGDTNILQHLERLRDRGGQVLFLETRNGEDVVMGECPVTQVAQPPATTVKVGMGKALDMMIDGIQELAIGSP